MFINIIISAKNYKSIILFLRFFFKFCVKRLTIGLTNRETIIPIVPASGEDDPFI